MKTVNPYLNFKGNTKEAFEFYKSVFGGEFTEVHTFKETPDASKMPEKEQNMIMHVSLPLTNNITLMGSDVPDSIGVKYVEGNSVNLSIETDSEEEATMIYERLSEGGQIEMKLEKTFWGAYFGAFKDKYGIHWMVNYTYDKK